MNIIQCFLSNNTGLYSRRTHLSTAESHFFPSPALFGTLPVIYKIRKPFLAIIYNPMRQPSPLVFRVQTSVFAAKQRSGGYTIPEFPAMLKTALLSPLPSVYVYSS